VAVTVRSQRAFGYIRGAMPFQESKSLTADELYAVLAYILNLNGIIGPNDVIDAQSLAKVKIPNRDGFISFPAIRSSVSQYGRRRSKLVQ
jgi:hypothetical protein